MTITFTIPLKTKSVANAREGWKAKAFRNKRERETTMKLCPKWTGGPVIVVTLTRIGPRELDGDNLAGALKGIRDGVAARLRIDDGSPLVRWDYAQEKGEPGVRVMIEATGLPRLDPVTSLLLKRMNAPVWARPEDEDREAPDGTVKR